MEQIKSLCRKCDRYYLWQIGDMNGVKEDPELKYDYERAKALWNELKPNSGKKLERVCHTCAGSEIRMFLSRHCKSNVSYEFYHDVNDYLSSMKEG